MKKCLDEMGLPAPSLEDLMNEFLTARIFERRSEDRIAFRYRGVMEYFIAYRMTVDRTFKDWVLEESRYLMFVNELLYYAGKQRNDPDFISLVRDRHLDLFGKSTEHLQPIDLSVFDTLPLPQDEGGESIEETSERLSAPPLTQEEKDEEIELDTRDQEGRQEVYRPRIEQAAEALFHSLVLYSGLVRNFEHMADALKREHLGHLWRSWATMMLESVRFAPRIAKERKLRINGVLYEVQAPQGMSDAALLKQMLIRLPHAHIKMIATTLGTEKLSNQLIAPELTEGLEPKVIKLFRVGLISELRLDETPSAVRDLVSTLRDNVFLLWSLTIHLGELRRLDRIRDDHVKALIPPLATAIAEMGGGSKKDREERKRKQLAKLSQDHLILKMKREK